MRKVTKKDELNARNLQSALWETIRSVKAKKMKPSEANAIAAQARGICQIAKLNIEYAKITGVRPSKDTALLLI